MRVLFTSVPLVGHLFPMVPLAWALRSRGDDVLVACPTERFSSTVTTTGLPVGLIDAGIGPDEYAKASAVEGAGEQLATAIEESGRAWGALSARISAGMGELADDFRPDLVISEPCEYAGRLAAYERDIPWIEHSWALPGLPAYAAAARTALGGATAGAALPAPSATIHPCPPSLTEDPAAIAMRYVPYNGPARLQQWHRKGQGRPRALVTFGSLLLDRAHVDPRKLVTKLVESLTEAGFELVLGLDEGLAASLRPWPEHVLHAGWVTLNLALPHCDLVIHHGGSGTAMAALVSGVPQLIVPQATDQFVTAETLASSGAALGLTPEEDAPDMVAAHARRLLSEPVFRKRAAELAAEMAALPAPALVAEKLHIGM
ncbi:glycosyltransferase [Nonomuraea sp. B19D2]|uniref:glycosyltransferase n=1 Tax=Nonomuraea sp. B19D2 TaxID=3159561 RepID=UPI0032DB5FC3